MKMFGFELTFQKKEDQEMVIEFTVPTPWRNGQEIEGELGEHIPYEDGDEASE